MQAAAMRSRAISIMRLTSSQPVLMRAALTKKKKRTPLDELTTREQEIFNLAVRGFSNEGIAGELGISVKTVETHRARINRKLNVHCTGDLVRLAARHGLIQEL